MKVAVDCNTIVQVCFRSTEGGEKEKMLIDART